MPPVGYYLTKRGHTLNFYEAVAALEAYSATRVEQGSIRFCAHSSLAFPAGDIASITTDGAGRFCLTLTFMGLYGASSPLPVHFLDYINSHSENSKPLADFLNIFNNRLYALLYRSGSRYNWQSLHSAESDNPLKRMVTRLSGAICPLTASTSEPRLAAFCGLLAGRRCSAVGLATLLSDYFGALPVTIRQFVPRWITLKTVARIGVDARLGLNTIAGRRVRDAAGSFRVQIGPVSRTVASRFSSTKTELAELCSIVKTCCNQPLAFDVELILEPEALVPVKLGATDAPLGQSSSLGESIDHRTAHAYIVYST